MSFRVLITVPSLERRFGGPALKARQLALSLRDLGCDVEVVGCGRNEEFVGLPILTRLHATPIPRSIAPIKRAAAGRDIVHVLGYRDPVGTAAAYYARRSGIPYLLEPVGMYGSKLRSHKMKRGYQKAFGDKMVAGASKIIATSQIESNDLMAAGIDGSRIVMRPNGVDVDDLLPLPEPGTFRSSRGIPRSARLVLVVSRIAMTKGLTSLAEAVASTPDMHCVFAGPVDRDGTLEALMSVASGCSRIMVLPGGLWGHEKAEAYSDADCFCLPSETESFGIAAAEAAAVGLPVVVSDRCGGREFLPPRSTYVFPFGDVSALSEKLLEVTETSDARRAAAAEAPALRERLKWSHVADEQMTIYEVVLRG